VRRYLLIAALLCCTGQASAQWLNKVLVDPKEDTSYYSLRTERDFPGVTLNCVSIDAVPFSILQIDRLTTVKSAPLERIEIKIDANQPIIFFPTQHKINTKYAFHNNIQTGIETVSLMSVSNSGDIQFAELVRQFIAGNRSTAKMISGNEVTEIDFSLIGFTAAFRPMRNACLENSDTVAGVPSETEAALLR